MRRALLLLPLLACDPQAMAPAGPDGGHPLADPHDPLSMPASPTLVPGELPPAESCADCHPEHYAEWRTSMHAYAMTDPLFRALVAVRSKDFGGQRDAFCVQCHSAIGTRGGRSSPASTSRRFRPSCSRG